MKKSRCRVGLLRHQGTPMVGMSEPHIVSAPNEVRLTACPDDAISAARFGPEGSKFLLASSWDCTVGLYDTTANALRLQYRHPEPVLDCAFLDVVRCLSGGLDGSLKMYDFNNSMERVIGQHDDAIKCIEHNQDLGVTITGSWDRTVKTWDARAGQNSCLGTFSHPNKIYSMSSVGNRLVVATAERKVWLWDTRQMGQPLQQRESSLKYQTRCVRLFPNLDGYVLSSIEGRVAVEYLDQAAETQKKKYAFKCHRHKAEDGTGVELIYPVNAIAFHPLHNTFASGGSDSFVNIWDPFNKKRLCQFRKYPSTITSVCFSSDGAALAIAASYMGELPSDPVPIPERAIFVRRVTDVETKPKS